MLDVVIGEICRLVGLVLKEMSERPLINALDLKLRLNKRVQLLKHFLSANSNELDNILQHIVQHLERRTGESHLAHLFLYCVYLEENSVTTLLLIRIGSSPISITKSTFQQRFFFYFKLCSFLKREQNNLFFLSPTFSWTLRRTIY